MWRKVLRASIPFTGVQTQFSVHWKEGVRYGPSSCSPTKPWLSAWPLVVRGANTLVATKKQQNSNWRLLSEHTIASTSEEAVDTSPSQTDQSNQPKCKGGWNLWIHIRILFSYAVWLIFHAGRTQTTGVQPHETNLQNFYVNHCVVSAQCLMLWYRDSLPLRVLLEKG